MAGVLIKSWQSMGYIDPRDFGAAADGATDCTAALNAAMTAASPGQVIYFPPGDWHFAGNVTCQPGVTLAGAGRGMAGVRFQRPFTAGTVVATAIGTRFLVTGGAGTSAAAATPFLTPADGTTIEGISFLYPNQGLATSGTIVAYPYTIGTPYAASLGSYVDCSAYGVTIRSCVFANAYQALRLWSCYPLTIEDCLISAAKNALWVDQCYDTSTVRRVMVTPWGLHDGVNTGVAPYLGTNLIAYRFGRADSIVLADSMVYNAATGILLEASQSSEGGTPWFFASDCALDYCDICIDCQAIAMQGARLQGLTLTTPPNGWSSWNPPNSIALRLGAAAGGNGGALTIVGSAITSSAGHEVTMASGLFRASGCRFGSLGVAGSGTNTSIVASGGSAIIVNCDFADARPQLSFAGGGKAIFANCVTGSNGVSVTGVTPSNCV